MNAVPAEKKPVSPWRWRPTTVHDLDWFPQNSDMLLQVRFLQKRGVLTWPAATLCFGEVVVLVTGATPNDYNGVDLWAEFSPFAATAPFRVARECRKRLQVLTRMLNGRALMMGIEDGNARAAAFAEFLNFRPTGRGLRNPVTKNWMEMWQWQA